MTPQADHSARRRSCARSARPRALAIACVAVLAAAGWIYLGLMLGRARQAPSLSARAVPAGIRRRLTRTSSLAARR